MIECLKRRHPFPWVDLQNLLHEIDEIKDLPSLINTIIKWNLLSLIFKGLKILHLEFIDVLLLQKLNEVEKGMVPLRLFHLVVKFLRHTGHQELSKGLEVISLLLRIEEEESISMY